MRDLRRYAQQTNIRLLIGFILLLLFVGDGLIYYFYGASAAISGLICIGAGLFPLVLIWVVLLVVDWVAKQADK